MSEQGRELLAQWKAEHSDVEGDCPTCQVYNPQCYEYDSAPWPCSMSRCIAALEEALRNIGGMAHEMGANSEQRAEELNKVLSKLESRE